MRVAPGFGYNAAHHAHGADAILFTGIIDLLGTLRSLTPASGGARLELAPAAPLADWVAGESIAVNGVCLTVEPDSRPEALRFFLSTETLQRSTLGALEPGALLNLERALRAGDRLGGHIVSGHVDAVGSIVRLEPEGDGWLLEVAAPPQLAPMLAPKGSVCVDGISLTIVRPTRERFSVALIPHTVQATRLRTLGPGVAVNLEVDPLARYVVHALETLRAQDAAASDTAMHDLLRRAGYVRA